MIWNKKKMKKGIGHIPVGYFSKKYICPVCSKKVVPKDERFNKTKAVPYLRYFDKFYHVHKECFYIMYEGISDTVEQNIEEYTAYRL